MKAEQLATLRFVSLLLLLPGLVGMIVSAATSSKYARTLPAEPRPGEQRMIPRSIHGVVVYQTANEERKLDLMEYTSVSVFLVGLGLSCVYLSKWGSTDAIGSVDDHLTPDEIARFG